MTLNENLAKEIRELRRWRDQSSVTEATQIDWEVVNHLLTRIDHKPTTHANDISSNTRWVVLRKRSPSGAALFVCTHCGRVSKTPDKTCPEGCIR